MLKNLREGANSNPWIYKTVMFLIALAFVVTMGWGAGGGNPDGSYVAQVGEVQIDRRHYRSSKERAFRYYREILGENFKEDMVQQMVINSMIERELWLNLSGDLNLRVGKEELRATITHDPTFFNENAVFDPERYTFFLSRSGISAADYEHSVRQDLIITKAKQVVQDGVALTEEEISHARALVSGTDFTPEKRVEEEKLRVQNTLAQKRQRVLSSVLNRVRAGTTVEIQEHLL